MHSEFVPLEVQLLLAAATATAVVRRGCTVVLDGRAHAQAQASQVQKVGPQASISSIQVAGAEGGSGAVVPAVKLGASAAAQPQRSNPNVAGVKRIYVIRK